VIYIVTGDGPGSGVDLFLKALEAGGMEIVDDERCNWKDLKVGTERLCPEGESLNELTLEEVMDGDFPNFEKYDGKVFKLYAPPWGKLTHIRNGEYLIVWIHRPAEERWLEFLKGGTDIPHYEAAIRDMGSANSFKVLVWRDDTKVLEVFYDDVINKPIETFRKLRGLGWPVNPDKSGDYVNAKKTGKT